MTGSAPPPASPVLDATRRLATTARRLAGEHGRSDLVARVAAAEARLVDPSVAVLVVGEFKQGKSSLVNGLVQAAVCPVDDDVATVAPTLVRHAPEATAEVVYAADQPAGEAPALAVGTRPEEPAERREPVALDAVGGLVAEAGNPGNARGVRRVEIGLPRSLLATGLVLVDTPGVGGLASVHTAVTLAALPGADAVVFVTDASGPLTAAEVDFLARAREGGRPAMVVLTKTDLFPAWRRIAADDRAVLDAAGLGDVEVQGVASPLRMLAAERSSRELNDESGYPALVRWLRTTVAGGAALRATAGALADLDAVAAQLQAPLEAEREALADPATVAAQVSGLEDTKRRVEALRSQVARWSITLNDGIADLSADVDHDLRVRTRDLLRRADEVIDAQDPAKIWERFEPWVYARMAEDVAANATYLTRRAEALAVRVAEHFLAAERDATGSLPVVRVPKGLGPLAVDAGVELEVPGWLSQGFTALRGAYGGILMFGMFGSLAGLSLLNPLTLAVGLLLGRKTLREERERQLTMRRQQARTAVRRYVDEATFAVGKETRDALRAVQRDLRDTFSARAEELTATTAAALVAAQEAARTGETERRRRLAELDAARKPLVDLRARIVQVADAAEQGARHDAAADRAASGAA